MDLSKLVDSAAEGAHLEPAASTSDTSLAALTSAAQAAAAAAAATLDPDDPGDETDELDDDAAHLLQSSSAAGAPSAVSSSTTRERDNDDAGQPRLGVVQPGSKKGKRVPTVEEQEAINEIVYAATLVPETWVEELDGGRLPEDEAVALVSHPDVYAAYIERVAASTASARNYGIAAFSSQTTASLLRTAGAVLHNSGARLSHLIDQTAIAELNEREPAAAAAASLALLQSHQGTSSAGSVVTSSGLPDSLSHHRSLGSPAVSYSPALPSVLARSSSNYASSAILASNSESTASIVNKPNPAEGSIESEADKLDRLERKKEAAREGWKKRRAAAEERATLEAAGQERPLTKKELQAARRREQRREAKLKQTLATAAASGNPTAASSPTTSHLSLSLGIPPSSDTAHPWPSSPALPSRLGETVDYTSGHESDAVSEFSAATSNATALMMATQAQPDTPYVEGVQGLPTQDGLTHQPASENGLTVPASLEMEPTLTSSIGRMLSPAPSAGRRKRASSANSNTSSATGKTGKRPRLSYQQQHQSSSYLAPVETQANHVKTEVSEAALALGALDSAMAVNGTMADGPVQSAPQQPLYPHQRSPAAAPSPFLDALGDASMRQAQDDDYVPDYTASTSQTKESIYSRTLRGTAADNERKIWATIARSSIPKVLKVQQQGLISRQIYHRRLSGAAAREAKKYNSKAPKAPKDIQIKARRVMRELLLHLKGNEKHQRETKRKAEKEVLDKARKEEEMQEAKRQARKLNFLITQTELYSHFVGSKLKTAEMEESEDTAGTSKPNVNGAPPLPPEGSTIKAIASGLGVNSGVSALDFNDEDETNLLTHARMNAESAVQKALSKAKQFDQTFAAEQAVSKENYDLDSYENGGDQAFDTLTSTSGAPDKALKGVNIDEMNFQNPTMAGDVEIAKQPAMLSCTLKEYQLKGLNWLANLYEQGINGILADEMGLGKTVQSISLMAYLAEVHNIWGPFLVVAPASTLHNWQQEIAKFTPSLKVLPYWGNVKDRTTLRKFWNRKSLRYDKNAPFHILITSYQLVVTDEQYFSKVKWQYMVLDEAQAIKSSASSRWRILLGFNCRNRLLLTGTPIQNSMQELWALLHFIMPSLFDSHNEFSEWFAKDIEGGGDKNGAMNESQLRRLHMILKPFMLRRIKKNVQNELADKIEIDVYCDLTPRQRHMYRTLRQNISVADLISKASSLSDDDSVKRLMNLIMQFRKVCNHPELFERADVEAPFSFANYNQSYGLAKEGKDLVVVYSTNSYLDRHLPRILFDEKPNAALSDTTFVAGLMNIWSSAHIAQQQYEPTSAFAFIKPAQLEPKDVEDLSNYDDPLRRIAIARQQLTDEAIARAQASISGSMRKRPTLKVHRRIPDDPRWRYLGLQPLDSIQFDYAENCRYGRSDTRFYIDAAVAPPPVVSCSSRAYQYKHMDEMYDLNVRAALYGVPDESTGIIGAMTKAQLPLAAMQVPQLHKLILDSGKLAKLDELLVKLKSEGHRVLVYFQMTRMIDLMEEYLAFRQYKYLRLDGSSSISERRDMVTDWQTKPEIFIFLLSTRAGGLGINLTAADTVIFYDSDWNPSNDAQAMDRAHRLGQTRQVTVYRLITKNTIDERILQLARTKKSVQDAVVGSSTQVVGGGSGEVKSNEVVSLLLDDDELAESIRQSEAKRQAKTDFGKRGAVAREENKRLREVAAQEKAAQQDLHNGNGLGAASGNGWTGEDDDDDAFGFFSSNKNAKATKGDPDDMDADGDDLEEGATAGATTTVASKGKGSANKGKATAPKKSKVKAVIDPDDPDAPPKKKRATGGSKKKAEPVLGPDGQPIIAPKKPRAKAAPKKKKGPDGMPLVIENGIDAHSDPFAAPGSTLP